MLSISNDTIYLSDGGIAVLPASAANNDNDSTNEIQLLSISNDTIYLSDGGIAVLPASAANNDNDSTNEIQLLSISNDTIYLSDGGIAVLPASASNNDNDSTNEIQLLSISNDTIYLSDGGIAVLPATSINNDNDSTNEIQMLSISNDTIYLSDGGIAVLPASAANNDNDSTNEIQLLSISNDTIYLSDGGIAVLPASAANNDNDSTNEIQLLSISNDTIYLSDGGIAVLPASAANNDNDSTNEIQVLSISNDTIYLSDGGFAVLPAVAVNNDNDSTNEYIDSLYFSGTQVYISQAKSGFRDSADISLINYWNKTGNNLNYTLGTISIGTTTSNGALNILDPNGKGIYTESTSSSFNVPIEGIGRSSGTNNNVQYGIRGQALGTSGTSGTGAHYGVYGLANGAGLGTIATYGIGQSSSSATNSINRGIEGEAASGTSFWNQGAFGISQTVNSGAGYNAGIMGAVSGHTTLNYGVLTLNTGTGTTNYGGAFFTYGNVSGNKKNYGVYGYTWGADTNIAVYGYSADDATAVNYGVYGRVSGTNSLAGYFFGNVAITGNLAITGSISKGSGTFKIDHPQDPENKMLVHSFVESPDMMNVYNGNVITDKDGMAIVELPDYFESLNMDYRYQLTVVGQFAQAIILEKVQGNKFVIKTDLPNVEVSWQVTGIRNDPYSQKNRIVPVMEKEAKDRGLYIHPEAYNQDESKSMFKPLGDSMNLEKVKKLGESAKSSSSQE